MTKRLLPAQYISLKAAMLATTWNGVVPDLADAAQMAACSDDACRAVRDFLVEEGVLTPDIVSP
jgi:hypothetical protein